MATLPPVPIQAQAIDPQTGRLTQTLADWLRGLMNAQASAGSGVTAHGSLTGLLNDDHPQYHTDARGDLRYYTKAQVDSSLASKENSLGNPASDGLILSSTAAGVRSWITGSSMIDGGSPSSVYGGTTGIDGGSP